MKRQHAEKLREELNCLLNLMNGSQFPGRAHAVRTGIENALAETNRALARPRWLEALVRAAMAIYCYIFGKKQERSQA